MLRCGRTSRRFAVAVTFVVLASVSVLAGVALAAYQRHLAAGLHPPPSDSSSTYSSAWRSENSYSTSGVDRTVTLIDNVSYSWHGTNRGTSDDLWAHWYNSTVKKGYCNLHSGGYVASTVFDF
jgi:hypothetical protein